MIPNHVQKSQVLGLFPGSNHTDGCLSCRDFDVSTEYLDTTFVECFETCPSVQAPSRYIYKSQDSIKLTHLDDGESVRGVLELVARVHLERLGVLGRKLLGRLPRRLQRRDQELKIINLVKAKCQCKQRKFDI